MGFDPCSERTGTMADRALYAAKGSGRDRIEVAVASQT
jgi:PleD family two-component response regulator